MASERVTTGPLPRLFDCFVVRPSKSYEYLLLHRSPQKLYAGSWRMVAGKVEPHETAYAACLRELNEETGLTPNRLWAVPYVHHFYEWQTDQVREIPVFLAEVAGDAEVVLDDEHDDHTWCGQDHALTLLDWPGQRGGLNAAASLLGSSDRLLQALRIPP
jgi:dihydroneopterin triphosphate diphosphatase